MQQVPQISYDQLIQMIYRFLAYLKARDGDHAVLSFQEKNSFLGREENYKASIAVKAQEVLQYGKWTEQWIDSGKILFCAHKAMNCAGNLVNQHQQIAFQNRINPNHKDYCPHAAHALYHIFRSIGSDAEEKAFHEAKTVFGGTYDTLAYLFFVKDSSRFLPISCGNFEKSLASIGIHYQLSRKCSWENYNGFINIVQEIKNVLQDIIPDVEIRLIDAHTFLWVINEDARATDFLNWNPDKPISVNIEDSTEKWLELKASGNAVRKNHMTSYIVRNTEVARITKERAKGVCQLCGCPAPFCDKSGRPYLEAHHVIWLSKGGADSTDNTVALCPNCHTKMHVLDDQHDIAKLQSILTAVQ